MKASPIKKKKKQAFIQWLCLANTMDIFFSCVRAGVNGTSCLSETKDMSTEMIPVNLKKKIPNMMGLQQNRKLLELDKKEEKYVDSERFKLIFVNGLGPYSVFNISKIMLNPSRYIDYREDNLDEIENLFVYADGYGINFEALFRFLKNEEFYCAKKEMYNLAFNLKNIRENIELYKECHDNQK